MILASENFRDIEYLVPRDFFEQNNYSVKTASVTENSIGRFGFEVRNDYLFDQINSDDFAGIFFVGGSGSLDLQDNEDIRSLVTEFVNEGKVCGAICAAPKNLLVWELLIGKRCTGWNGDNEFSKLCKKYGAIFEDKKVVVDKNIVTGNGPKASEEIAIEFMRLL